MTTISGALATVAAGALAMTAAAPASARDRDGIDAGEIIAGAVILGGLAAILGNGSDRDDRRRYRQRRGNGQRAIEQCIRAVERDARRAGYRYADVTQINDVDQERRGWEIEGRLVVDGTRGYRNNRRGNRYDSRYDNRRYDDRGYARNGDRGRFSCDVRRGRIVDIDYSGIRGL
ncbi:MAG: hypothetical protein WA948_11405 [Pontixanthobacter sp.]